MSLPLFHLSPLPVPLPLLLSSTLSFSSHPCLHLLIAHSVLYSITLSLFSPLILHPLVAPALVVVVLHSFIVPRSETQLPTLFLHA